MAESKPEIKYVLPNIDINININDNNEKKSMNKFFDQFENLENIRNSSLIMTEISNSRIQGPSKIMNSYFYTHFGIKCQKCQIFPIKGHRYKCPKCLDYNLCEECEQLNSEVNFHPHSNFILYRSPEIAMTSDDYSYECLTQNLEIHEKYGVESFNIKLRLKNNGYLKWSENCVLKCKKEKSTIFCDKYKLPSIDKNEEIDVILNFHKCNKIPIGEYDCYVCFVLDAKIRRGPIIIKVFIE